MGGVGRLIRVERTRGPDRARTEAVAGADGFRADIEGLRGLAILLVVAFHAAPAFVGGGFVGVDVFFVISGYLITGLLVRELRRDGRIGLVAFYARRARRLLPAAILAIGTTFLLSAAILPPLQAGRVTLDGVASALSVANIRFAIEAGDYFTALGTPSPFLHYWSLSVEEQFYLLWPALLIIAFTIGRGLRAVTLVVAALFVISLAAAVVLTDSAPNWAFFSLPTRAWQLALGGLLAIVAVARFRGGVASTSLASVGWLGLAAVLAAGLMLDEELAYPGLIALAPTLGAAALIAGGDRRLGPGMLLALPPMRFLGRISYALYLWHWPLLVLPVVALGQPLNPFQAAFFVGLAVLIATVSTLVIEEPIRRGSRSASFGRQLAAMGGLALAMLLSVTIGTVALQRVSDELRTAASEVGAGGDPSEPRPPDDGPEDALVELGDDNTGSRAVAASRAPLGPTAEPTMDPTAERRARRRARRRAQAAASAAPTPRPRATRRPRPTPTPRRRTADRNRLPGDIRPALWKAADDEEGLRRNGCLHAEEHTQPKTCVFDPGRGRRTVALVGDSHASHWYPALRAIANQRGWRLASFVKVSCPFTDIAVKNLRLKREYRECARFNENVVTELKRLEPDLVVTALSRWQHPKSAADASAGAQGEAIARMLRRVPGAKVVIADVPYPGADVPECLSANLKDIRRCAVASFNRSSGGSPARERIAARRSGGAFLDFGKAICGGPGACPVVRDGRIVYRDDHHLTATFSKWLAPALDRALQKVLRQRR